MFKRKKDRTPAEAGELSVGKPSKKGKLKSKKKIIIFGSIAFVLLSLMLLPGILGKGAMLPQVSAGTAEKMDLEQAVAVNGVISGAQSAEVVSSLNFEIISILVEEGDLVEKGQVLAVLDGEDLLEEYRKAANALEESRFNYETSQLLYQEGALSQADYIRAKNAYDNARITAASFDVAEKTNIRSPISGTVTRVNVNLGRYANDTEDNKPMFVVEDLTRMKMDVKISEYDIGKIKEGQAVTITADVLGNNSVQGTVSRISPTGEQKDASSKEMVIPVQIDVNQDESGLIAGVTAKARILIERREQAMTVPIDAVLEDPETGESYVLTLQDTFIKRVAFTPGIEGDFYLEVASGDLSEGDLVVLSPTFDLADGMEVLVLSLQ
ncbi:MAG: efflux RND transporter periplasmic adaptor subunit [Bacillota bacterium]|nr:efflux RND transporter periplasmic adaptor subunit [Bacillota bacterium]NLV70824.1 efflux RND transporter periplasmic adaptor subunit [Clostridiales bacterium]HPF19153.1 efflux RND transporter periplasmic adaptor subunit [Bacillota bacterium]